MNLLDNFNIKDDIGISGFVVIKDTKTGEILVQKKNMILAAGKYALLMRFLYNIESQQNKDNTFISGMPIDESLTKYKKFKLSHYGFFNNMSEVTFNENLNLDTSSSTNKTVVPLTSSNTSLELDSLTGHITIKISTTIDIGNIFSETGEGAISEYPISSLSLIMSNTDNIDERELFSRITFDPITLKSDSSLSLTYYVYF